MLPGWWRDSRGRTGRLWRCGRPGSISAARDPIHTAGPRTSGPPPRPRTTTATCWTESTTSACWRPRPRGRRRRRRAPAGRRAWRRRRPGQRRGRGRAAGRCRHRRRNASSATSRVRLVARRRRRCHWSSHRALLLPVRSVTSRTQALNNNKTRMLVAAASQYRAPKSPGAKGDFGHFRLSHQLSSPTVAFD